MTETKNYRLKKPDITDPIDIGVLNENFDIVDDKLGSGATYIIDLSNTVRIDFGELDKKYLTLTDYVDMDAIIAAKKAMRRIYLKITNDLSDDPAIFVELTNYYEDENPNGSRSFYFLGIYNRHAYHISLFDLHIITKTDGVTLSSAFMEYSADFTRNFVKTVNGASPDIYGNVETQHGVKQPFHLDLSSYFDGVIRRFYADEEESDIINVTFDENGNPIKFSNGVEEFAVTWPAEDEQ